MICSILVCVLVLADAVNHEAAGLFEPRPFPDVFFLVEAGLHLKQHRDVLAIFGRFQQGRRHPRVVGEAVDSLLDAKYLRVFGSLLK